MKLTWNVTIQPDSPAEFHRIDRTGADALLITVLARSWDALPDLRSRAKADIETGNFDQAIKSLR